jgi:alkylation response protein AidB-like acyl-CoA dehydrogenase
MHADERALLEKTVRDALEGTPHGDGDGVLAELGWLEMLAAEPRDAIDVVFTALGATNATASVLDDVLAAALGLEPSPQLAVLVPPFATWAPPGTAGLATGRSAAGADLAVVSDGGRSVAVVPSAAVTTTPLRGIDPEAGWCTAQVEETAAATELEDGAWDHAVAAARRALGHQLSGACRTMLALAREHAVDRVQFGRPIAQFQAVRHRLAEALVAVDACDAALDAAWNAPGPMTAALAKASSGRAARTVATHCQQVLAGIGFTTDHPFHHFLKRTLALEGLFGSADDLLVDLGHTLIRDRAVPTLVDL